MHESWRLVEGFVADEGKSILRHIAKTRPNLVENHMALLLSSFISAGLLEVSAIILEFNLCNTKNLCTCCTYFKEMILCIVKLILDLNMFFIDTIYIYRYISIDT